jgi:hypothetical protein
MNTAHFAQPTEEELYAEALPYLRDEAAAAVTEGLRVAHGFLAICDRQQPDPDALFHAVVELLNRCPQGSDVPRSMALRACMQILQNRISQSVAELGERHGSR